MFATRCLFFGAVVVAAWAACAAGAHMTGLAILGGSVPLFTMVRRRIEREAALKTIRAIRANGLLQEGADRIPVDDRFSSDRLLGRRSGD